MNPGLATLVRNRPLLEERASDVAHCPFCQGKRLLSRGRRMTLLGGGDGTVDGDPNHVWHSLDCKDCGQSFMRETQGGSVWYTQGGRLLEGVPTCYENYLYRCAHCDGVVERFQTEMDGVTPARALRFEFKEDGGVVRFYRTFYQCDSCHTQVEISDT